MTTIPAWLKTDPFVLHVPDKTIFEPQRKIRRINNQPHLLDCTGQPYPLSQCDRLRLEHLTRGVALLITDHEPLTIYPAPGVWFVVTDGVRKKRVAPMSKSAVEAEAAARSLAQFFGGDVFSEEVF